MIPPDIHTVLSTKGSAPKKPKGEGREEKTMIIDRVEYQKVNSMKIFYSVNKQNVA